MSARLCVSLLWLSWFVSLSAGTSTAQAKRLFDFNFHDGDTPVAALVFDSAGNLYGTTEYGGTGVCKKRVDFPGCGTVFELTLVNGKWNETVLHNFVNDGMDGHYPLSSLVIDASGNLYGTTEDGGTGSCTGESHQGCGTVFELSPTGGGQWTETILHNFDLPKLDGIYPLAGLITDPLGDLYGTTQKGGQAGKGSVFELSPTGAGWTEKVIHSFNSFENINSGLVMDTNGNLFGTAFSGGGYGLGGVYELTLGANGNWKESDLADFHDDYESYGGVSIDSFGNLYGTTSFIDGTASGTVFEISPRGRFWTYKTLYTFDSHAPSPYEPFSGVIVDAAGNVYGMTNRGGPTDDGTLFKLTQNSGGTWDLTILYANEGGYSLVAPVGNLIFDSAGNLYGTMSSGGLRGAGTVFEVVQ
jgi:uncharacterized repeat protein (TIGR03803 family)